MSRLRITFWSGAGVSIAGHGTGNEMQLRRMKNQVSGEGTTKRRRHIRFPLRGAVDFRWSDSAGKCHGGEGKSRNISEQGIFVETPACPPLGTRTRAEVWIQHARDAAQFRRIAFEGWVVRVERPAKSAFCGGFAMATFEAQFARVTSN
jgi:hypothetical protein